MRLIILACTLVLCSSIYAQQKDFEIGLHFSPSLSDNRLAIVQPSLGLSTGLFSSLNLSQRIAFGTALEWTLLAPDNSWFRFNNLIGRDQFKFMRIPFWFSLSLNDNLESKWQYYFTLGYTFGKILNEEQAIEEYGLPGLVTGVHFAKFGFEIKLKVGENYRFTMGPQLEYTNIYDDKYGNIFNLQYVLRFGRLIRF